MPGRALYAKSPEWAVLAGRLDELLDSPDFRIVKRTSRTLAGITHVNGVDVFAKRVSNNSWLKGIIARVCGSRARKTIRGAEYLGCSDFAHPKLIAAFEQRHYGSVQASYVIVEYLRRPKILSRFALADEHDLHWRRRLSEKLAQTIRDLHSAGCYTRDLQETNVMLETQSGGLRIYFTDLEDFRWLPLVPWRLRLLNLIQLDRQHWPFRFTRSAAALFLQLPGRQRGPRAGARTHRAFVSDPSANRSPQATPPGVDGNRHASGRPVARAQSSAGTRKRGSGSFANSLPGKEYGLRKHAWRFMHSGANILIIRSVFMGSVAAPASAM